jgi:hypothetical protein
MQSTRAEDVRFNKSVDNEPSLLASQFCSHDFGYSRPWKVSAPFSHRVPKPPLPLSPVHRHTVCPPSDESVVSVTKWEMSAVPPVRETPQLDSYAQYLQTLHLEQARNFELMQSIYRGHDPFVPLPASLEPHSPVHTCDS